MFIDDEEKMIDFRKLSKDEFLLTYSYITEEEYIEVNKLEKFQTYLTSRKSTPFKTLLPINFEMREIEDMQFILK